MQVDLALCAKRLGSTMGLSQTVVAGWVTRVTPSSKTSDADIILELEVTWATILASNVTKVTTECKVMTGRGV